MKLAHFQQRIAEKTQDVSAAPVIIVAFGDSVTQGFTKANTIEANVVYHQRLKEMLEQHYPLCTFSVINAGVAGFTAADSLARLERDVIRYQPDLVVISFGLNDAVVLGKGGTLSFKNTLKKMLAEVRNKTQTDIILLTPNFMVTADNEYIHPDERHYLEDLEPIQTTGILERYAEVICQVAASEKVVLTDVFKIWTAFAKQGNDTNTLLANGLNHPSAKAHTWTAQAIFETIKGAQP